jgi:hypothetical protein
MSGDQGLEAEGGLLGFPEALLLNIRAFYLPLVSVDPDLGSFPPSHL